MYEDAKNTHRKLKRGKGIKKAVRLKDDPENMGIFGRLQTPNTLDFGVITPHEY